MHIHITLVCLSARSHSSELLESSQPPIPRLRTPFVTVVCLYIDQCAAVSLQHLFCFCSLLKNQTVPKERHTPHGGRYNTRWRVWLSYITIGAPCTARTTGGRCAQLPPAERVGAPRASARSGRQSAQGARRCVCVGGSESSEYHTPAPSPSLWRCASKSMTDPAIAALRLSMPDSIGMWQRAVRPSERISSATP